MVFEVEAEDAQLPYLEAEDEVMLSTRGLRESGSEQRISDVIPARQ